MPERSNAPIGVFDSGVGGLSVLQALQAEMPAERFVYVADSGHAPYGERDDTHVLQRSHRIAAFLIAQHHIKSLVVACNTATAAAIQTLRDRHQGLPLVGIEPALKPAIATTQTGLIAVLATRGTLNSEKFKALQNQLRPSARLILQPCDGLANAIECNDGPRIDTLISIYLGQLGPLGCGPGHIDSLVLGCTHYPFVLPRLRAISGPDVRYFDGGLPVARRTRHLLTEASLLTPAPCASQPDRVAFYTTGVADELAKAVDRWMGWQPTVVALTV